MSFCWLGYMSFFSECEISLNGTLLDSRLGHELIRSIQALLMWFYHDTPGVNPSALNLNLDGYINFWIQGSLDQKLTKLYVISSNTWRLFHFQKDTFLIRQFIGITTCIKPTDIMVKHMLVSQKNYFYDEGVFLEIIITYIIVYE